MTLNSFSDITQRYETTLDDCTCGDFIYRKAARGECCKHMEALRRLYAKVRREEFNRMRQQYDSRLNGQADTQRCYYEMSLGA